MITRVFCPDRIDIVTDGGKRDEMIKKIKQKSFDFPSF
jgi:hypothetical protein